MTEPRRHPALMPPVWFPLRSFVEAWAVQDPQGTTFIEARRLPNLIMDLEPPMASPSCPAAARLRPHLC